MRPLASEKPTVSSEEEAANVKSVAIFFLGAVSFSFVVKIAHLEKERRRRHGGGIFLQIMLYDTKQHKWKAKVTFFMFVLLSLLLQASLHF